MRRVSKYCQDLGLSETDKAKQLGEILAAAYTRGMMLSQTSDKTLSDPTFLADVMSDLTTWMAEELE